MTRLNKRQGKALWIGIALAVMPVVFPMWSSSWQEVCSWTRTIVDQDGKEHVEHEYGRYQDAAGNVRGFIFTGPFAGLVTLGPKRVYDGSRSSTFKSYRTVTTPFRIDSATVVGRSIVVSRMLIESAVLIVLTVFTTFMLRDKE